MMNRLQCMKVITWIAFFSGVGFAQTGLQPFDQPPPFPNKILVPNPSTMLRSDGISIPEIPNSPDGPTIISIDLEPGRMDLEPAASSVIFSALKAVLKPSNGLGYYMTESLSCSEISARCQVQVPGLAQLPTPQIVWLDFETSNEVLGALTEAGFTKETKLLKKLICNSLDQGQGPMATCRYVPDTMIDLDAASSSILFDIFQSLQIKQSKKSISGQQYAVSSIFCDMETHCVINANHKQFEPNAEFSKLLSKLPVNNQAIAQTICTRKYLIVPTRSQLKNCRYQYVTR